MTHLISDPDELVATLSYETIYGTVHTWRDEAVFNETADEYYEGGAPAGWSLAAYRDHFRTASMDEQLSVHDILNYENEVQYGGKRKRRVSKKEVDLLMKHFNGPPVSRDMFGRVMMALERFQVEDLLRLAAKKEKEGQKRQRKREKRARRKSEKLQRESGLDLGIEKSISHSSTELLKAWSKKQKTHWKSFRHSSVAPTSAPSVVDSNIRRNSSLGEQSNVEPSRNKKICVLGDFAALNDFMDDDSMKAVPSFSIPIVQENYPEKCQAGRAQKSENILDPLPAPLESAAEQLRREASEQRAEQINGHAPKKRRRSSTESAVPETSGLYKRFSKLKTTATKDIQTDGVYQDTERTDRPPASVSVIQNCSSSSTIRKSTNH